MTVLSEMSAAQRAEFGRAVADGAVQVNTNGGADKAALQAALDPYIRSSRAHKVRLLKEAAIWAKSHYVMPAPGEMPTLTAHNQAPWAPSTSYSTLGTVVPAGALAFMVSRGGTSAGSGAGPSGTSGNITDNTVIWTCMGPRAPVAYVNGLNVVAQQRLYSGGYEFEAIVSGTTASSGSGPTPANLTDGTATFRLIGRQTLPMISVSASAGGDVTQKTNWSNTANQTILGGTIVQASPNAWGSIVSRDSRASANEYSASNSGGGGSVYTVTDAPVIEARIVGAGGATVWVDGKFVSYVQTATGGNSIRLDFSGLIQPRKARTIRIIMSASACWFGFFAATGDVLAQYTPAFNLRAVHMGDSFTGGSLGIAYPLNYAPRCGLALGIEDYWESGIGSTGVLRSYNSSVNFTDRFTRDVIQRVPDLFILQNSNNDLAGVPADYSVAQLGAAEATLLSRVATELPRCLSVVMGQWNNRGPLAGNFAEWEALIPTICATAGVPFVRWSDYLTDGGAIGAPSGTGNSVYYTGPDLTHPSLLGHELRGRRVPKQIEAAYGLL